MVVLILRKKVILFGLDGIQVTVKKMVMVSQEEKQNRAQLSLLFELMVKI